MAVLGSSGCETWEAYPARCLFCSWEGRWRGGVLCQAAVALVAPAPLCPRESSVLCALYAFILGLRPEGQEPPGRSSFLGCAPGTEEETQLYACVSSLCSAMVPSPNTLLPKASQMAQPSVQRSEVHSTFYGRGLKLQDRGVDTARGEELGPFPPPSRLVAQPPLRRVN